MIVIKTESEWLRLYNRTLLDHARTRLIQQGFPDPSLSHAASYVDHLKNGPNKYAWAEFQHEAGNIMYSRADAEPKNTYVERS